jgi:hypothetical protein
MTDKKDEEERGGFWSAVRESIFAALFFWMED